MSQTATGTTTRVQMQREGQALIPHGNLINYDPVTGQFTAKFDFQEPTDPIYSFTPTDIPNRYVDQSGLAWNLVR